MVAGRLEGGHATRAQGGKPAAHPIRGDELRALRELQRNQPASPFVFTTERGRTVHYRCRQSRGEKLFATAFLRLRPRQCGHDTQAIQDLGHKAIQHTVRYTELTPTKF
jgi:type 1 fimbriae regulatory protein FimB/type 1 fimbriae regulatory protein FimE